MRERFTSHELSEHHPDLCSPSQVRRLISELDIVPSKLLGQNFLVDRNVLGILLGTLDLQSDDAVLEVGPGLGVVTEQLVAGCGCVIAVEKDERLCGYLAQRFEGEDGLELRHADMLDLDVAQLMCDAWSERSRQEGRDKFVSNLPYSAGTRILMDLVRSPAPPSRMVVTVQREVGERLTARAGTRDYGLLGVWAGLVYDARLVKTVSPNCFWPRPEVRSAIVCLDRREDSSATREERETIYRLSKLAFGQRRKQLATSLGRSGSASGGNHDAAGVKRLLSDLGIAENARPEALSVEDWCRLARVWG